MTMFIAAVLLPAAAFAQDAPPRPAFEVASVKLAAAPNNPAAADSRARMMDQMQDMMPLGMVPMKGTTVSIRNWSLAQTVAAAYRVRVRDVVGPGWASEQRYEIDAKPPAGTPKEKINEMLQALLEERFGLRVHREDRNSGGYAIVVGKDGPRLKDAAPEEPQPADPEEARRKMQEQARKRMEEMQERMKKSPPGHGFSANWHADRGTMAQLANTVAGWIHSPVADETGLTGKYEISIEIPPPESDDDTVEYRTARALDKLGLRLESRKVATTVVVIDAASKIPTEN